MKIYKTREFHRFSRDELIADGVLCEAVSRAMSGLIDAQLGNGLIKQRIARINEGKSGGYRTLMAIKHETMTIFLYGFAKNEIENINRDKLKFWRNFAKTMLSFNEEQIAALLAKQSLVEVFCHV